MKDKLDYIDSMRGIAILMVILVHTAQSVKGVSPFLQYFSAYGQMGVQLFFIASAYTLCHSWLKRSNEINRVRNFAIRRLFRIAPLYYLGIVMYFIVSVIENYYRIGVAEPGEQYSFVNILINLLFLNGFYPPANNNIVPGGWSIGTEMCFYAIFPILMFFLKGKAGGQKYSIIKYPLFGLLISQFIIFSLWIIVEKTVQNNNFIYFNVINQLPVFLIGVAFYFLNNKEAWPVKSALSNLLYFLLFTMLSLFLWKLKVDYCFSVIPFFSGISFVFLTKAFELTPFANFKVLREIGKVSYSMYIFHFIFAHKAAQFINHKFHIEEVLGGNVVLVVYYLSSVIFVFGIAKISERFIEYRFIQIGSRIIKNRTTNSFTGLAEARR